MSTKVDSLKEKGNTYFKNKDYKKAIQYYKEGLELNPANWVLNNNIAQAYLLSKNYSEAETHAVVSVALQENSVKGYYRAAKAAYHLNKTERALTYVRKGLSVCPDSEELSSLLKQLKKPKEELHNGYPESHSETKKEKDNKASNKKDRSRSSSKSRMPSSSRTNNTESKEKPNTPQADKNDHEPKNKKKGKSTRGPIEIEDIQKDKVLQAVEDLVEEQKLTRPIADKADSFETIRRNLSSFMKEGSEALEKGLARSASEKYKSAIDIIVTHNFIVFGMKEIDYVILRYSLSISYIETANYSDIVKSLDYLREIEERHSAKLPAVYYALGNAYCKLNRFRVALEHLDKGLQVIDKGIKFTTHPWPGTMNIIKETKKSGLQESLETLIHYCKTYRGPDATCRYERCRDISTHVIPSEFIFYSDPDYIGYVVVICEENCKITYHIQCWRAFKDNLSPIAKLSEKDMLGRRCLTSDCLNELSEPSVIVKIEIYGDDGNIKTTCSKEPNRVINNNTKENKKEKKKKTDKTDENNSHLKTKAKRKKQRKTNTDLSTTTTSKDVATNISDKVKKLEKLDALRKLNFGYLPETTFMPNAEYFGRSDLAGLESYLTPEFVGETPELKNKKEFVFTYFFEYINTEGPQKIKDIEDKWKEEVSQFHGVTEFMSENDGICNFLLQSYRFAALDDYLCVASQLPDAYNLVNSALSEGLRFKLGRKSTPVVVAAKAPAPSVPAVPSSPAKTELVVPAPDTPPMSPVPVDHCVQEALEDKVPEEEPIAKVLDSSIEMYFSDAELSDSESEDVEDADDAEDVDEEEEEEDVPEEALDDEEDDDVLDEDNNDDDEDGSNHSSITGLNPNAQEFIPPAVQATTVEKFYDDIVEQGGFSNDSDKEKFVEYVSSYFLARTGSATNLTDTLPDLDTPTLEKEVVKVTEIAPPAPTPLPLPEPNHIETQTEPGRNFEEEIEKLSADVKSLHNTVTTQAKTNEALQEKYEKDSEKFQETIKAYDEKIVALESERIKEIQSLKLEISKKDTKMDTMKKKYTDQIEKLNKKVDDDSTAHKEMESKLLGLTETVTTLTSKLEEEQQQGKKFQKLVLDAKSALANYMVQVFRDKCSEKLQRMRSMTKYLTETDTPSLSSVEEAIKQWEVADKQAEMISEQFKIQYAVLSKRLEHSEDLGENQDFFATSLPKEPACPLDDLDVMIQKAIEERNSKKSSPPPPAALGGGGDASVSSANKVTSDARPNPHSPFPYTLPHQAQGQNLYLANNSMPYRFNSFQTSVFGAAPAFAVRMPPPVPLLPSHIVNPVPSRGFVTNGSVYPEQERKFSPLETSESKPVVDPFRKSSVASKMEPILPKSSVASKMEPILPKSEPSTSRPIPISTPTPTPAAAAAKPPEKKKLSSVAGLTPIEVKTAPAPVETKKSALAPKPAPKTHTLSSDSKAQSTSSQKMWRYQKLLSALKDTFRTEDEAVLADCLATARERNNNTLSGLTIPVIYEMVGKVLKERTENLSGHMAMDKFGGCPWGGVKESKFDWNKPAEDFEECIICHIIMTSDVTPLQCKHAFHTECIRKWLKTNSTCPICRKYTTLNDEFPPLA